MCSSDVLSDTQVSRISPEEIVVSNENNIDIAQIGRVVARLEKLINLQAKAGHQALRI